ncbi:hypothetical protein LTR08_006706 [Meristemomyces frigidus]|nr:hypothetical protein LTR08_006706 [Meristemomyces frigidus]
MKCTSMLAALSGLLSVGIQSVGATCYGSGASWPNTEEARTFVHDACYNSGGMFTGYYNSRQTKSMCPKSGNLGLQFVVQNTNTAAGFDLGDDDCYNRLSNEIFGCEHGGASTVSGWYFK